MFYCKSLCKFTYSSGLNELKKWDKMDCYVVLHSDFSNIQNMPWLHQTHRNRTTKNLYITNTIKPIMSDLKLEYVITFVYNQENYTDFISNNIDNDWLFFFATALKLHTIFSTSSEKL